MRLFGAKELAALLAGKSAPDRVSLLRSVVDADMRLDAVDPDAHRVALAASVLRESDALWQFPAVAPVPMVLATRSLTQVAPPIVFLVAIQMVNVLRWPLSSHHCPDHPMAKKLRSAARVLISDLGVQIAGARPNFLTMVRGIPSTMLMRAFKMVRWARRPPQFARVGIVGKALEQIFPARQPSSLHLQSFTMELVR